MQQKPFNLTPVICLHTVKWSNNYILPTDETLSDSTTRARGDLSVMAIRGYSQSEKTQDWILTFRDAVSVYYSLRQLG